MITTIYLCRHAKCENPKGIFYGRLSGFHLGKVGKLQAQKLAKILTKVKPAAIYSSPLERAFETAFILAQRHQDLEVIIDNRLLEIRSPLQGKPNAFIDSIGGDFYRPQYLKQGGESVEEIKERVRDFFKEKVRMHKGETFIAVTHADLIMIIKAAISGLVPTRKNTLVNYIKTAKFIKIIHDGKNFRLST